MSPLTLLLALAPLQETWTPLPLPGLCVEPSAPPHPAPVLEGGHLRLHGRGTGIRTSEARRAAPAPLPASLLVSLIEEDARRGAAGLTLYPAAGNVLFVRGPEPQVADLAARLADLDEAGRRLDVELDVRLVPSAAGAPANGESAPADADEARADADEARARGLAWKVRARSGEEVFLGQREHRPFVASFQVDVASDSGVAAPVLGRAAVGKTLHLVASRAAAGTWIHLEGLLDMAELAALEDFDPGTPDLGVVQQPFVRSVQVAFSGAVRSGEPLRVSLRGTPLESADWTLSIHARAAPEPAPSAGAGWELIDLSLLARAPRSLPALEPGATLEPLQAGAVLPRLLEPHSLTALATAAAGDARGAGFPRHTDRLFLVERGDGTRGRALRELAEALERPRLDTRMVELEHGSFHATFPVTFGAQARVRVGEERTWLLDYDAQIAPDTWMPAPIVERAFDGLAWQGVLAGPRMECTYWVAATASSSTRSVEQARLGALQLPLRRFRGDSSAFAADGERHELLAPAPDGDAPLHATVR